MIGTVGSLLLLVALVATILSGFAFVKVAQGVTDEAWWKRIARQAWFTALGASVVAFGLLIYLFGTHQYQYAYVYANSSNDLPTYFTLAATWAGQEGSFLLWIVYTGILGALLIRWGTRPAVDRDLEVRQTFEAPVLAVFALCQFFLLSMVAGHRFRRVLPSASRRSRRSRRSSPTRPCSSRPATSRPTARASTTSSRTPG